MTAAVEVCPPVRRRAGGSEAHGSWAVGPAAAPTVGRQVFVVACPNSPGAAATPREYRGRPGTSHPGRCSRSGQRLFPRRALAAVARAVEQTVWTLKVAAVAALVGVTFAAVLVDVITPEPAHEVVEGFTPRPPTKPNP